MKRLYYNWLAFCMIIAFSLACKHSVTNVDVPDVQGIYDDIRYLDSLLQSKQVDSISGSELEVENLINSFSYRDQSPDEQAILDSINKIKNSAKDFLRFCVDSRSNLELLNQDILATETQYKSGKVKAGYYISALIESEQTLVDINNRYLEDRAGVLLALNHYSILKTMLNAVPGPDSLIP